VVIQSSATFAFFDNILSDSQYYCKFQDCVNLLFKNIKLTADVALAFFTLQTFLLKGMVVLIFVISGLQFFVEIALAASLQSLLFVWGLLPTSPEVLDLWPFGDTTLAVVLAFIVFGTMKGLLLWASVLCTGVYGISLEVKLRSKIAAIGLENRFLELGRVADFFNDKAVHSASFNALVLNFLNRVVIAAGLFVYLLSLAPLITLIACISLIFLAVPIVLLNKKLSRTSKNLSNNISKAMSILLTGVKNSLLLHIYGTAGHQLSKANSSLQKYKINYFDYFIISGAKSSIPVIFGIWFVAALTFSSELTSALTPEDLIAFLYLFMRFVGAVSELSNLTSQMTMTFPRANQLMLFFEEFRKVDSKVEEQDLRFDRGDSCAKRLLSSPFGIRLNQVSFSYSNISAPLLDNLQLDIKPSSVVVIVGQSGVGKSTLLSLIIGLQNPASGMIEVYNNEKSIPLDNQLRANFLKNIGYVGPENFIIHGTIKDNLQYGLPQKSDDDFWQALLSAKCDFVKHLPGKLEHALTEQGEGLSAGQKQRLSIARALLRRPSLLILDEATSNLDLETEKSILEMIENLNPKMTVIFVSHRMSVLKVADAVVSMSERKIEIKENLKNVI
jgi:ATP-binding cassette, subfamily C, bacterial